MGLLKQNGGRGFIRFRLKLYVIRNKNCWVSAYNDYGDLSIKKLVVKMQTIYPKKKYYILAYYLSIYK